MKHDSPEIRRDEDMTAFLTSVLRRVRLAKADNVAGERGSVEGWLDLMERDAAAMLQEMQRHNRKRSLRLANKEKSQ